MAMGCRQQGQVQTSVRWAGRPAWLYRVGLLLPVALLASYVWRHPPQRLDALSVALTVSFLLLVADHLASEWSIVRTKEKLVTKARELDR